MRLADLNPGSYNVTVFEGRTTDSNGRFGKIWVDDINGKKEPAEQNTGNYSGVNGASTGAARNGRALAFARSGCATSASWPPTITRCFTHLREMSAGQYPTTSDARGRPWSASTT